LLRVFKTRIVERVGGRRKVAFPALEQKGSLNFDFDDQNMEISAFYKKTRVLLFQAPQTPHIPRPKSAHI